MGVFLFFLISGEMLNNHYGNEINILEFYKKRALRIFIPFYITYIIAFFMEKIVYNNTMPDIDKWKIIFTLLASDGYFPQTGKTFYLVGEWFTTVILLIYILYPLIRKCLNRHPLVYWIIIIVFDYIILKDAWRPFDIIPDGSLFFAITFFSLGMIWPHIYMSQDEKTSKKGIYAGALFLFIILIIGLCIQVDTVICNSIISLGIYSIIRSINLKSNLLITKLANYSYYIYLTHHYVIRKVVMFYGDTNYICLLIIIMVFTISYSILIDLIQKVILDSYYKLNTLLKKSRRI